MNILILFNFLSINSYHLACFLVSFSGHLGSNTCCRSNDLENKFGLPDDHNTPTLEYLNSNSLNLNTYVFLFINGNGKSTVESMVYAKCTSVPWGWWSTCGLGFSKSVLSKLGHFSPPRFDCYVLYLRGISLNCISFVLGCVANMNHFIVFFKYVIFIFSDKSFGSYTPSIFCRWLKWAFCWIC